MKHNNHSDPAAQNRSSVRYQWLWLAFAIGVLVIFIVRLRRPHHGPPLSTATSTEAMRAGGASGFSPSSGTPSLRGRTSAGPTLTAEEIVASKVSQFGRRRREFVQSIARRSRQPVPPEVERFFEAVEAGQWDEIKSQWDVLARRSGQYDDSTNHWAELDPFWPAVLDAYGVAEQAHLWPAQKLLDYGNAILDALRPGMVYVGGTDNGRWIPELLNETGGAEQHIIVTQNALADARYLDFVNSLYGDRMTALTTEDSQAAFQQYVADAQRRFEHDQQHPDEPKQVLPGEDIRLVDGRVQVSGMTSVMAINAILLQTMMSKNPDLSFAIEESSPLKGTYPDALPLGPLMELGARSQQDDFTTERAAQSLQYWQTTAQEVLADPEAANSPEALKSYSHDAVAAANLLAAHNFTGEAEQAYRLATQLWPENPESVSGLADLLVAAGRPDDARQLLQDFAQKYPGEQKDLERISASWHLVVEAQPATH